MIATTPYPVWPSSTAWNGDEGVDELIALVDERVHEQAVLRGEYRQVITRMNEGFGRMDEQFKHVDQRLERIDERFERVDQRFIEVERHFEVRFEELSRHLENRFDRLGQRLEDRLDRRFGEMDQRLDRMDQRLDRMDQRFDEMYNRMLVQSRWLIGSIALLGTVISILLAIGQFVK